MKRIFKMTIAVVVTLVAAFIFLKVAVYWEAFRAEHRAERLLATVAKLQPGITSVKDLQRDVFPLDAQFEARCGQGEDVVQDYASYNNIPSWKLFTNEHTPEAIRWFERKWILPRWTMFSVSLACNSVMLTRLRVTEMQENPEWPHPFSNTTEVLPKGAIANAGAAYQKSEGRDYWMYERRTGLYDNGKLIRESPVLNRFVFITPDSTPKERQKAFDFHLDCFTRMHGCQNADLILRPVPNR